MNINNALVNGKITNIGIENGKIACFSDVPFADGFDVEGKCVIPGLIDVHTHGCAGHDTMDADYADMCRFYAAHGTTTWLPTTMTMDRESLKRVTEAETEFKGANIAGFHLEGPFISMKYKGAQNPAFIRKPSMEEFAQYKNVGMISLAPEVEGAMEFIREASRNCIVSIGHTDCDYDTAIEAIENGAMCLTHTFNAMPPLHHRNPGPIAAGFEKHIYAQIICDGLHIAKPMILAAYRLFGADRMVLISDSLCCAGLPDGNYKSGGLDVYVKNGEARLADGTIAGSNSMLWDCVKKAVEFGIPFEDAVKMASATPAEMLGLNKGKIEVGYDADIVVVEKNLTISCVLIGGEIFS